MPNGIASRSSILTPDADTVKSLSGLNLRRFRTLTLRSSARIIGLQMSGLLRELIDSVRTQLQADLDARLGALADQHEQASAEARIVLLTGIRDIDAAQSVSDALSAIARGRARNPSRGTVCRERRCARRVGG